MESNDEETAEEINDEIDAKEKDIRTVTITLDHYENIVIDIFFIITKCKNL